MSAPLYERIGGHAGLAVLLRHFYADVRQHRVIGPIFNERIHDWPEHLEKIAEFWARLTGGPSTYAGAMPARHLALGLQPAHFAAWLDLWEFNCRRHLNPLEAQELSDLARQIGSRLSSFISSGPHGLMPG
jgi:hemoglobin